MTPTLKPSPKQHQAWTKLLDSTTEFIVFGGSAYGGKSWLGCEWLMTNCYKYPGSKWFIGREELKRIMSSTYQTWIKVCQYHKIPPTDWHLNGQYNYIEFTNGSRIDLLDLKYLPTDPLYERFGSTEYTGGWIEEAGEVDFGAFDVLKTRKNRWRNVEYGVLGKILITCNPKKNWLYQLIWKPWKQNTLGKEYCFIQSLPTDNTHGDPQYVAQLSGITDMVQKQRLLFGNWEYEDDPSTLCAYDAIVDLFTNTIEPGPRAMTVDVARLGKDTTTVKIWEGLSVSALLVRQKQLVNETAKWVDSLSVQWSIPRSRIVVDEDGVGGGVVDLLPGCKGFVANSSPLPLPDGVKDKDGLPIKPNFKNLKSQCGFMLAEKVNSRALAIKAEMTQKQKDELIQELEQLKGKDIDKDGKRQLMPKDEIKEVIGRSPDKLDCLIMRMLLEIIPAKMSVKGYQYTPKGI